MNLGFKSPAKKVWKIRLKKGDKVVVRAGKYKGQSGVVLVTHPADNTVTVEGINIIKKHQKPNKAYPQGGIVSITKPIAVGKVGILDPNSPKGTVKATRVAYSIDTNGVKKRVYAKAGKEIK